MRLTDAGWEVTRVIPYPETEAGDQALTVRASYRVRGGTSAGLLYTRLGDTRTQGNGPALIDRPTLSLEGVELMGAMAFQRLGFLEAGAGPAIARGTFHWVHGDRSFHEDPVREGQVRFGGVAQLGASATVLPGLCASVTGRQMLLRPMRSPEYLGLEPFDVPLSRPVVTLGLGARF